MENFEGYHVLAGAFNAIMNKIETDILYTNILNC